jgi:hypothetical protein
VAIPPSGEVTVRQIPFTQQKWISYEAQWSDGEAIADGTIRRTEPGSTYFYYMFVPRTNPRAEYFFVGTPSEKDRFLQKATWTAP